MTDFERYLATVARPESTADIVRDLMINSRKRWMLLARANRTLLFNFRDDKNAIKKCIASARKMSRLSWQLKRTNS